MTARRALRQLLTKKLSPISHTKEEPNLLENNDFLYLMEP